MRRNHHDTHQIGGEAVLLTGTKEQSDLLRWRVPNGMCTLSGEDGASCQRDSPVHRCFPPRLAQVPAIAPATHLLLICRQSSSPASWATRPASPVGCSSLHGKSSAQESLWLMSLVIPVLCHVHPCLYLSILILLQPCWRLLFSELLIHHWQPSENT